MLRFTYLERKLFFVFAKCKILNILYKKLVFLRRFCVCTSLWQKAFSGFFRTKSQKLVLSYPMYRTGTGTCAMLCCWFIDWLYTLRLERFLCSSNFVLNFRIFMLSCNSLPVIIRRSFLDIQQFDGHPNLQIFNLGSVSGFCPFGILKFQYFWHRHF